MRIAVDLDDVLADLIPYLARVHAELTGEQLAEEQITGWDVFAPEAHDAARFGGGYRELEPRPGAGEFLRWLRCRGHEIYIVTYRSEHARQDTEAWLAAHTGHVYDGLHLVGGGKSETCSRLDIELMIDDSIRHLTDVIGVLHIPGILVETPMNRKALLPPLTRRACGLDEVKRHVEILENHGGRWPEMAISPSGI